MADSQIQDPNQDNKEQEEAEVGVNIEILTPDKVGKVSIPISRADTIQDVKQFLLESAETCFYTHYHFEHKGQPISDFVDFASVPDVVEGSQLVMVEDEYDETSARIHSKRLREILTHTKSANKSNSPSLYYEYGQDGEDPFSSTKDEVKAKLGDYFPQTSDHPKCLKKLVYSAWNPVPGNRKLQGDLFYLDVVTLEGTSVVVTASTSGFFVNGTKPSAAFNPNKGTPKDFASKNLVSLLKELSPKFKETFASLTRETFSNRAFDLLAVPFPVTNWVAKDEPHTADFSRSEDALIASAEIDHHIQGQSRDWNEELQSFRELKKETIQDRIIRDRALFRSHTDFVEAASQGAISIIDGAVPPINPVDDKKAHMYIFNNIFFSFAVDNRDYYKNAGGDATAHKHASNDLAGVLSYNRADIPGLYTLGTAVIDYRGHRIVAQTIIPGLFSSMAEENVSVNIVYGTLPEGKEFKNDEKFQELLTQAGEKLHIKQHKIADGTENNLTVAAHADIKGIMGSDGRRYILDLIRTTPRDPNFTKPEDVCKLLRPELIELYISEQQKKMQKEKIEEIRKAQVKKSAERKDVVETKEEKEAREKQEEEELVQQLQVLSTQKISIDPFNNDLYAYEALSDSEEVIKQDKENIKVLGDFLKNKMIPTLVDDMVGQRQIPIDGQTLTTLLHSRGINLRYLGQITKLVDDSKNPISNTISLCLQREMIARAAKQILNNILRTTRTQHIALTVANVLNAFFGRVTDASKPSRSGLIPQQTSNKKPFTWNHHELWHEIRQKVTDSYGYTLPELVVPEIFTLKTLRSICQKVGIQLRVREYDFSSEYPFNVNDVVRLYPIVKHSEPRSEDALDLLEGGQSYLLQGRLDIAFELLSEALSIFNQVYGAMHKDTALCYTNLAKVHIHTGEVQIAAQHQQKAVVIYERVLGLDHYETSQAYFTLALMLHQLKPSKIPLRFLGRAYYLLQLFGEPNHVDNITFLTNIGMMLQELDFKDISRVYIGKALSLSQKLYGENMQTARLYHMMAISLSLVGNFKEALNYEKQNYEICKNSVGEQDMRTMESNIWLGQLTRNAVNSAKLQQNTRNTSRLAVAKQKNEAINAVQNVVDALSNPNVLSKVQNADLSSLPVADLLKWIESSDNVKRVGGGSSSRAARGMKHFSGASVSPSVEPEPETISSPSTNTTENITTTTSSETKNKKKPKRKNK
eukprot:TRINITY_DN5317_c0_g1_i1.p1 TRINITY_DN5317_c0_g1~~TRINITY_DN5317_c0_g1_i1.p1  ORF type:complete len:1208 (-),score=310.68 TRINITY_DN5317_c0_g1_i1:16-3639(-)